MLRDRAMVSIIGVVTIQPLRARGRNPSWLFLQPKTINIGKLCGDALAVFLGGLEAGLFHCLQRFFIEARHRRSLEFPPLSLSRPCRPQFLR